MEIQDLTLLRVVPSWCVELQRRSGASLPIKMSHTPLSRLPCYQNTDLTQDFKLNNIIKINSKRKKISNNLSVSGIWVKVMVFFKGFGVIFKRLKTVKGFIKRYITHQWTFHSTHEAENFRIFKVFSSKTIAYANVIVEKSFQNAIDSVALSQLGIKSIANERPRFSHYLDKIQNS